MEKAFTFFLFTLFLLMASSVMTQTNITTDQLALLSLKSQIISDLFHFLDESWSPATSVCHWVGVTCGSRHQRVKSLNLSNMALTGWIPREFANLSFLVSLDMGSNNFHGNLPREMARLRWLKFLDLSVNNFSGKVLSWFGFLHLRHRNLVKVITSCSKLDFKALVLEYIPNGSLDKYLYSHNYFLDIRQRLSIMLDVACALEYLHHGWSSPVIRCDVKPSNVLLDEDMVSHLSDFGISKLLGEDESDFYTKTLATLGYIAPEYGLDGLVSTNCDVYSYGVLLL
ncbi:putative triacylglycerol lipase 2-like [Capsicum annuum]|uniref:Protein kinase domain-containing protein n=1 Tax=Capsicum annuum TaxID=4072 RepID=A0A1U8EN91_CAPAN|nr:probable LRR receptor-like serine/threonine-protein kinase At3g47570 [Capsicum annuum]KAF3648118.1 putative triacylglycerol lipase 2-like [Capsicum annuum]KAF3656479.1 putative triacylglycerol lipase 2-like [Capsicum annuum]PHT82845.1 hypothetical protein T459_11288 [Capsicum annuum]